MRASTSRAGHVGYSSEHDVEPKGIGDMGENTGTASKTPGGWRIFGFGRGPETAAKLQEHLRSLGYRATIIGITDDAEGDARIVAGLTSAELDGVTVGGAINGQDPIGYPATDQTTRWFNRSSTSFTPMRRRQRSSS